MYQEILDAIHYSCVLIQDEIVEELEKKGQKMEFDKEVVAQMAFVICDTLCFTWPSELLQFAKHARRSIVNISDLTLLFRRNENMLSIIQNALTSSSLPARKRQSRKNANKTNNKATDVIKKVVDDDFKDVGALRSGNKDAVRLTDFWNRPSTSREKSLISDASFKYTSEIIEQRLPSDLISLERKNVTNEKKGKLPICGQKVDFNIESKKTDSIKEKRVAGQSVFHLTDSESEKNQDFLDNDIPSCPREGDLQEQEPEYFSVHFNVANQDMRRTHGLNLSSCSPNKSEEINSKNATILTLGLENEVFAKNSVGALPSREAASHILANKSNRNKREFEMRSLPDEKPDFCSENAALKSMNRISKKQRMDTLSKNKSTAADDCFSSFKFESDDEDSDQSHSLVEIKATNDISSTSPSNSDIRYLVGSFTPMNDNQQKFQNTSGEESDIDLDATVFDF